MASTTPQPSTLSLLTTENEVFASYLFYSAILVIKVLSMVLLTARYRFSKRIFISQEDTTIIPGATVVHNDPDIERVRRAHLNDLENIPLFFVVAFGYVLTDPSPLVAINLFRVYTLARIMHTFVYAVIVIPQPARLIAFIVGVFTTLYMAFMIIITFFSAI